MAKNSKKTNPATGSSFDDFLKEEGIFDAVRAKAVQILLIRELDSCRKKKRVTKEQLALKLGVTQKKVELLLDDRTVAKDIPLGLFIKATHALGEEVRISPKTTTKKPQKRK
jgi:antitoxin HicB